MEGNERCIEVCEDRGKVVIIGAMNARVGNSEVYIMVNHKRLLDLLVVQEEERNKLLDVNVLTGEGGGGVSDHHLVVAKIRCLKR